MPQFSAARRVIVRYEKMFCPNCGNQIADNAKFCSACGSPIAQAAAPAEPAKPVEPVAPVEFAQPVVPVEPVIPAAPAQPVIPAAPSEPVVPAAPVEPVIPAVPAETEYSAPAQPVYSSPAPGSQTAAVRKKRVPVGVVILLSILFGILIFVLTAGGTAGFAVRTTLAKNQISENIASLNPAELEIGDVLSDDDILALMEENGIDTDNLDDDMTLAEAIAVLSKLPDINAKGVKSIIDKSSIMPFVGDVVKSYEDCLLTGSAKNVLTKAQLIKLIEENEDKLYKYANYDVQYNMDLIEQDLDNMEDDLKALAPSKVLKPVTGITKIVLSLPALIGMLALAAVLIFLLGLSTKSAGAALMTGGVCAVITGGILTVASFMVPTVLNMAGIHFESVISLATAITAPLVHNILLCGLIALGAGAVMIIAAVIINIVSARIAAKRA